MPRSPSLDTLPSAGREKRRFENICLPKGENYRNGPGKIKKKRTKYDHPFEGDGMVTRFAFDGRGVRYATATCARRSTSAETRAKEGALPQLRDELARRAPSQSGGAPGRERSERERRGARRAELARALGGRAPALARPRHAGDTRPGPTRAVSAIAERSVGGSSRRGSRSPRIRSWSSTRASCVKCWDRREAGSRATASARTERWRARRSRGSTSSRSFMISCSPRATASYFLPSVAFRVAGARLGTATPVGSLSGIEAAEATLLLSAAK